MEFKNIKFIFIQVKLLHPFPSDLLEDTINKITRKEMENNFKVRFK